MLTLPQFTQQLFNLGDEYRADNAWVGAWRESWNDPDVMTRFITCAYNLYAATATNALELTVLGGTELRTDDNYVRNFGVTGANGIQDAATKTIVAREQLIRNLPPVSTNPGSTHQQTVRVPVVGVGSILSEEGWTPILNDALIVGAITGGQNFFLGLTPAEQAAWNTLNGAKVTKVAVLAADRYGETAATLKAWKAFFNRQRGMFFGPFGPRVFTRELLGLSFFGYKPEFKWHQLGFAPGSGPRPLVDFQTYLAELRNVHFEAPCDERAVMQKLSSFLFGDQNAIGNPWV